MPSYRDLWFTVNHKATSQFVTHVSHHTVNSPQASTWQSDQLCEPQWPSNHGTAMANMRIYKTWKETRRCTYRVAQNWHHFLYALTLHQILTDFQNYFTVRIRRKFVIILSLKIPPHLKCFATLPWEMSNRRRNWPMVRSMKRWDSFPHSVTIACFSWLIVVNRPPWSSKRILHVAKYRYGQEPQKMYAYSVPVQETAKHRAKFSWPPFSDIAAVTKPRRETRWNLLGCPKLANRSPPLVDRSSPVDILCHRLYCFILSIKISSFLVLNSSVFFLHYKYK